VPWPVAIGVGAAGATGSWDAINAIGTDVASSGTINLTTATGPNLTITGTTTITTVTLGSGNVRFARANAAFQLTASANLIINGSASTNYTTTAGDLLIFIGASGSITRVWAISGSVAAASNAEVLAGTVANKYVSPATAYFPTGFTYGLTLTTNVLDATNDVDISVGAARSSDDTANMLLLSALGKRLDAAWAVGGTPAVPVGGLDTGAVGNNTYYVFLIKRVDTGVVDALFSLSRTAPTLPANYTVSVLLGSLTRAAGVNGAVQTGRRSNGSGPDVIIEDQKPQNTEGGTFTAGANRTRDLNTKVYDPYGYASVASNQVTLIAGTYSIRWSAPGVLVNRHQSLLYNVTDTAEVKRGTSEYSPASQRVSTPSTGGAVVTITASKAFEIRHICETTAATSGFGQAGNFGIEVYTRVEITKVA
jgi:hypothetical protein